MVTSKTDKIHVEFIPATKWWKKSKWRLIKSYTSANGEVIAPFGFVTDGATIPGFLSSWFTSTGRYFGAAIVHDFVLANAEQPANKEVWDESNRQFKEELKALNIAPWRLWILLNSVRVWAVIRTQIINKFLI